MNRTESEDNLKCVLKHESFEIADPNIDIEISNSYLLICEKNCLLHEPGERPAASYHSYE